MQISTAMRYFPTSTVLAKITEQLYQVLIRIWKSWNSHSPLLECKMLQSRGKPTGQFLKKEKNSSTKPPLPHPIQEK